MKSTTSLSALTTWSVELWHYYTNYNTGINPYLIGEVDAGTQLNFALGTISVVTSPAIQLGWAKSLTWYNSASSTILPTTGAWYHIVATFDGTTGIIYVNNAQVVSNNIAGTPTSSNLGIYLMRKSGGSVDCWGGKLALVRIYNVALTASEVNSN